MNEFCVHIYVDYVTVEQVLELTEELLLDEEIIEN